MDKITLKKALLKACKAVKIEIETHDEFDELQTIEEFVDYIASDELLDYVNEHLEYVSVFSFREDNPLYQLEREQAAFAKEHGKWGDIVPLLSEEKLCWVGWNIDCSNWVGDLICDQRLLTYITESGDILMALEYGYLYCADTTKDEYALRLLHEGEDSVSLCEIEHFWGIVQGVWDVIGG